MDELHIPKQSDGGVNEGHNLVTVDARRLRIEDQRHASGTTEVPQGVVFDRERADRLMAGARAVVEEARQGSEGLHTALDKIERFVARVRLIHPSDIPDSAVAMVGSNPYAEAEGPYSEWVNRRQGEEETAFQQKHGRKPTEQERDSITDGITQEVGGIEGFMKSRGRRR
ncbi:MAG: hypothetical protein J2P37_22855 [Ktedonobacteraceae bacterium]|nr:hypothetical protein [Ktedonobacteraceae bacterium]